jgi:MFS family permease
MFAAMILWLPLFAAQGMIDLAMAWAIFSAVNPAVTSLMFTIISLSLPDSQRGSVLSMVYLPMNLAFIVGPFAASFVASNLEVRDVFLVSAALSLLALVIFIMNLRRTSGHSTAVTE